ncbi:arabinosyltransferase domain-containing protein [Pseudonocardia nematodicida]|uniref:Arabinosyltransferase domain-containing protein n=1 Tax=Pseudonocardia nematodicida TaxID=1206997 RepID=A0ABV1KIR6_9PSEU
MRTHTDMRRLATATLVAGLLAAVLAALVPLAPVETRETTVEWPPAGDRPVSTTAAFVPYAPESVRVLVPCRVLRDAEDRARPTTVVSSERVGEGGTGFTVLVDGGDVRVRVGGREIDRTDVGPGTACDRLLIADAAGTTLTAGDDPPRVFPGDVVRSVAAFTTELSPAEADGLRVTARTADWFVAEATGTKWVLLGLQWLAAAVALVLLSRLAGDRAERRAGAARLRRARLAALRSPSGAGRTVADVLVVGTLAVWTVIGPLSTDDGFTEAIARNTGGDDLGNVYRWSNASEAPYTLVIRMVQAMTEAGAGPLLLRVPSVLAGIAVWVLVSRVALPAVLPRRHRAAWVRGVLGLALLAWWLPLNLGVRPEPFAALATTAALCCALRAAARPGRRLGWWIGTAALASGLALAVTPSSVTVAGALVLLVPAIWRRLTRPAGGVLPGLAGVAAALGIAAAGLTTVFTGQSLYTVARATEMHRLYGPVEPWFREFVRWEYLLGFGTEQGGLGRRVPVLLTIALLLTALPLVARGAHRWAPGLRWAPVPLVGVALGFVLLAPTPSKWTHYFGTLAGTGALAVATGCVLVLTAARLRPRDATVRGAAAVGTLAAAGLAALAYTGRNEWFLWSSWGVPRAQGPFTPLDSPRNWLLGSALLGAVAVVAVVLARRRAGRAPATRTVSGRVLAALPAGVVLTALLAGVSVVVGSLAVAPARQGTGYSVGGQMAGELAGRPGCGLLDHVTTTAGEPVVPLLREADGPVYGDWSILWAAPCLRELPAVRAGLAQTPRYLVLGPSSLGFALDVSFTDAVGGSFAPMRRTTTEAPLATRIDSAAGRPAQADWGSIVRIDTDLARDTYDVRSAPVRRWGWEGDHTPFPTG